MSAINNLDIRFIAFEEWDEAIGLVYRTFLEFDAPLFSEEGIKNFRQFISDNALKRMFEAGSYQMIGAYLFNRLVGVIALRDSKHISLLFVDKNYQGQGIGRSLVMVLMDYVAIKLHETTITVNSSPYAVEFYHSIGFVDLDVEKHTDGIRYTPMKLDLGV